VGKKHTLRNGHVVEELDYDPSPEFALDIDPQTGEVKHWMSFDPRTGPESEAQINYFAAREYPGADKWEVGVPIKVAGKRAAAAMAP